MRARLHPRLLVLAVAVPIVRIVGLLLPRLVLHQRLGSIRLYDFTESSDPVDRATSEATFAKVNGAFELLRRDSPRVVSRLARSIRYIAINGKGSGLVFDPISRSLSITSPDVTTLSVEQLAVLFGTAAARARFGWNTYRASPDAAAQMQRRMRREGTQVMTDIGATYPTMEWFAEWLPALPPSPSMRDASIERYAELNQAPRWMVRLRRYLWD